MLAAQLNELGVSQQSQQAQPEAPPRNNRQASSTPSKPAPAPPTSNNHQPIINPLDPIEDSDTDSEPEETNERRNDGTLLASDPPKPL